jgi:hypothetical protein
VITETIEGFAQNKRELIEKLKNYSLPKEDRPKIKNHCESCAAFHTPFCTWEYTNLQDEVTKQASRVDADAVACSLYFPRPRIATESEKRFLEKVELLE